MEEIEMKVNKVIILSLLCGMSLGLNADAAIVWAQKMGYKDFSSYGQMYSQFSQQRNRPKLGVLYAVSLDVRAWALGLKIGELTTAINNTINRLNSEIQSYQNKLNDCQQWEMYTINLALAAKRKTLSQYQDLLGGLKNAKNSTAITSVLDQYDANGLLLAPVYFKYGRKPQGGMNGYTFRTPESNDVVA